VSVDAGRNIAGSGTPASIFWGHQPNCTGKLVGPLMPSKRLPRRRSDAPWIRQAAGEDLERFGEFASRQVGAEAVVHPSAERQDGWRISEGDVHTGVELAMSQRWCFKSSSTRLSE
jgi:hypothetical protein